MRTVYFPSLENLHDVPPPDNPDFQSPLSFSALGDLGSSHPFFVASTATQDDFDLAYAAIAETLMESFDPFPSNPFTEFEPLGHEYSSDQRSEIYELQLRILASTELRSTTAPDRYLLLNPLSSTTACMKLYHKLAMPAHLPGDGNHFPAIDTGLPPTSHCYLKAFPVELWFQLWDTYGDSVDHGRLLSDLPTLPLLPSELSLATHAVHRLINEHLCLYSNWDGLLHGALEDLEAQLYTTIHRDAITQERSAFFMDKLASLRAHQSDNVPKALVPLLKSQGIDCSSTGLDSLDHGAHKAIEMQLYAYSYPSHVSVPTTIMQTKLAKYNSFVAAQCAPPIVELQNLRLSEKDVIRYKDTPRYKGITTPGLFFWDAGHHLTVSDIAGYFSANPNVDIIYAPGIYPGETLTGHQSVAPELYTLSYNQDRSGFDYILEGTSRGFYSHNVLPWALIPGTRHVTTPESQVSFTTTYLDGAFAHANILHRRGTHAAVTTRQSTRPLLPIPDIFDDPLNDASSLGKMLIPRELVVELDLYWESLKRNDPETMAAKLRNLRKSTLYEHVDPRVWYALSNITLAFAGHHRAERANNIDKGLFARFILACRRRWQRLDTAWYDNLLTGLINLAAVPSFAIALTAGAPLTIALASVTLGVSLLHSLLLGFATLETYRLRRATLRADTFSDYISLPFELSWSPQTSFHEFDNLTQHPIQTHFSRFDQDEPYPEIPLNANLAPAAITPDDHALRPLSPVNDRLLESPLVPTLSLKSKGKQRETTTTDQPPTPKLMAPSPEPLSPLALKVAFAALEREDQLVAHSSQPLRAPVKKYLPPALKDMIEEQPDDLELANVQTNEPDPTNFEGPSYILPTVHTIAPGPTIANPAPEHPSSQAGLTKVLITGNEKNESANPIPAPPPASILPIHPECHCPEHDEFSGGTIAYCPNGEPWYVPEGAVHSVACHFCYKPVGLDLGAGLGVISSLYGLHYSATHNHTFHAFKFAHAAPRPMPNPDTCAMRAWAVALNVTTNQVWEAVNSVVPADWSAAWSHTGGDVRFMHACGLAWKKSVYVSGYPKHLPNALGLKNKELLKFHFTRASDERPAHWQFIGVHERATNTLEDPKASKKVGRSPEFQSFIDRFDRVADKRGNKLAGSWVPYTALASRADQLVTEMANGTTGVTKRNEGEGKMFKTGTTKERKARCDNPRFAKKTVLLRNVAGCAGCAKSSPCQFCLNSDTGVAAAKRGFWRAHFARAELRADWKKKVPLVKTGYSFNTWEVGLTRDSGLVIVDELSLMFPGFLDALILVTNCTHVMVLHDPCQISAHNPSKGTLLNEMESDSARVAKAGGTYALYTHRSPKCVANFLNIQTTSPVQGSINYSYGALSGVDRLCFSEFEVTTAASENCVSHTIPSFQGREARNIQIQLSSALLTMGSVNTYYTAITRATHNITLIIPPGSKNLLGEAMAHPFFGPLLSGGSIDFEQTFSKELANYQCHRLPEVERARIEAERAETLRLEQERKERNVSFEPSPAHPASPVATQSKRRSGAQRRQARAASPPSLTHDLATDEQLSDLGAGLSVEPADKLPDWTQALLSHLPQPVDRHETSHQAPAMPEVPPKTHLPLMRDEALFALVYDNELEREQRELCNRLGLSNCFPDGYDQDINSMFPQQKADDAALFNETVKKRLTRKPITDVRILKSSKLTVAQNLFDALCMQLDWHPKPRAFDHDLFTDCVLEQELKKVEGRSSSTLLANEKRSDPDADPNEVMHFVKSQLKAKVEALLKPAKAGQTLALCHDSVLFDYGPCVKYVRRVLYPEIPDNIILNIGLSPSALSDRVRGKWVDRPSTANDYTAFDASQGYDSVLLECHVMRLAGLPDHLVDGYEQWKTSIRSNLIGPKDVSRDTGEPGTFDFNTLFSIAVSSLKYGKLSCLALFGGDDSAINQACVERPQWALQSRHVAVVSKTFIAPAVDFCGYLVTSDGLIRNPTLMYLKTVFHIAKGDLMSVLPSYLAELHTAYRLGDLMTAHLGELDLHCLGFLVELGHRLCPTLSAVLFSRCEYTPSALQALRDSCAELISRLWLLTRPEKRLLRRQYHLLRALSLRLGLETPPLIKTLL
jgi:hypothetical protein